ncbi:universal stress protein UspA [Halobiforma lacisalsi AJ5]|uniref:Universal stress protein UspA n=1 Tax=Natronobacterium lacisalsi AJ5 TaxID=358396 RepID=M0LML6_NATLA|nr:universal stress protein [Halobiforma lacisalsi]APW98489.1 universal stress protein UspA [Halobiforma lacisalsi AJ5]EMA33270.1 UspA domain-containing protein [Halobiforma lacisalsi AJ5]
MYEYDDVLIATDGSDVAADAADAGIALARTLEASVRALSVVEEGFRSGRRRDRREAAAEEVVTRAREAGRKADATVRTGRPADEIREYADSIDADLLVVGTHGRTGLRQALLGSVALEVIRDAERPVMTVGAASRRSGGPDLENASVDEGDAVEGVCLATDGSIGSAAATDRALSLAEACDARLHALYAVDADDDTLGDERRSGPSKLRDAFEEHGKRTTAAVADRAGDRGLETVEAIERGPPTEVILEYVDRTDVDLLVMGTESKSNVERLVVGSVSQRVVPNASVPVLTARTLEDESDTS